MLAVDIPGFGLMQLEHLVCDFTGTLFIDGKLLPGIQEHLLKIANMLSVHIITNDTFENATTELKDIECKVVIITGKGADIQKENYVKHLGVDRVVAIGNGSNDRRMLKAARLGIAVIGEEGCSSDAIMAADIVVKNILDGFGLLLNPKRLIATLRF